MFAIDDFIVFGFFGHDDFVNAAFAGGRDCPDVETGGILAFLTRTSSSKIIAVLVMMRMIVMVKGERPPKVLCLSLVRRGALEGSLVLGQRRADHQELRQKYESELKEDINLFEFMNDGAGGS